MAPLERRRMHEGLKGGPGVLAVSFSRKSAKPRDRPPLCDQPTLIVKLRIPGAGDQGSLQDAVGG